MTQDMTNKIHQVHKRDGSCVPSVASGKPSAFYVLFFLFLMLTLGGGTAWADDFSGIWYIANETNHSNANIGDRWYLVPARDPQKDHYADAYFNNQYCDDANGSGDYTGDNYGSSEKPFITTYKTSQDLNSVWIVVPTSDGYYYIIHARTGKYLVYEPPYKKEVKRKSIHLETLDTPRDNAKFAITGSLTGVINIRPESVSSGNRFFNPASNNANRYYGTGTYLHDGMVGLYDNAEGNSQWYFEKASPIITFTSDGKVQISAPVPSSISSTIYYSTDGTDPTTEYTGEFTPAANATCIKAKVVINNVESNVSYVPMLPGSERTYLIQSLGYTSDIAYDGFFLQPGDANNSGDITVTTSSVARPLMQWYLVPAGNDSDRQYFYFVKPESGNYLYCNSGGSVYMKTSTDFDESDDYKFFLLSDASQGFRIVPKSRPTYWINKNSGHNANNAVNTSNNITDLSCRWNSISVFDHKMPAALRPAPFTVSDNTMTAYYKIVNASATDYFIVPSATYVTTSSDTDIDDKAWFFKEAESDDWLTYYYIVNGVSGEYMYFNGNQTSTGNNNAFVTKSLSTVDKDRYQFVVAKTQTSATDGKYYIVPKVLKDLTYTNYSLLWREGTNNLKTQAQRADDARKWTFTSTTFNCNAPVITYNSVTGEATITCTTPGAKIYYVRSMDDTEPDLTDATVKATLTLYEGPVDMYGYSYIKAIATRSYDDLCDKSAISVYGPITSFACATPVISYNGETGEVSITCATVGAVIYYTTNGNDPDTSNSDQKYNGTFTIGGTAVVKAIAVKGTTSSAIATCAVISSWDSSYSLDGTYFFTSNFTAPSSPIGTAGVPFTGTIDGGFNAFSLNHPLIDVAENATIKNVIISSANISGGSNAGAIANVAKGDTRIYNCGVNGGTISGTGNVGSLVGLLDESARVINCYSRANVTGGSWAGGIVGYNNYASKSGDIRTMVMNCWYAGNVSGGTDTQRSPIYSGLKISNAGSTGLNNYNYFSYEKQTSPVTNYNCALAAQDVFLTQYEFFRYMLNSNRELAAWYATGDASKGKGENNEMAKWVGTDFTLMKQNEAPSSSVINTGDYGVIHEKLKYNYNTVQLPYYTGSDNYKHNRVVVGWNVSVSGGSGTFESATNNYANRDANAYSGRVFSQGAYVDVPEGATITYTPVWADCVYLVDPSYDVTYPAGFGQANATFVSDMGTRFTGGSGYKIHEDDDHTQIVYTDIASAVSNLPGTSSSVYDKAIVLVGNYHHYFGKGGPSEGTKGFTIMSADLDNDHEPDYGFICQHGNDRSSICPIRFDFINSPGIGMVQKVDGYDGMPKHGIWHPKGWFEVTNTCLIQFTQFEYDNGGKSTAAPLILQGGIFDQLLSAHQGNASNTSYIHLGGNVWVKEFYNGTHVSGSGSTKHAPISITGGQFDKFYLSGMFNAEASVVANNNAECYISGGKFGDMAGAGQEQIDGNVTWRIDHADITNFFGGGINAKKEITGNIDIKINDSKVALYCGGPKFGNMHDDKTVTTVAKNTTFTEFYGAGYGGTSYYRHNTKDLSNAQDYSWDSWANDYTMGEFVSGRGIATNFEYEFIPYSGGAGTNNVGRFYVNYASLSLAETKNVVNTLTECTIENDFYGGGNLGRVDGTITSTLTDCTVKGSVYGGGYSASAPKVKVFDTGSKFSKVPSYNANVGIFNEGTYPNKATVEYTWQRHDSKEELEVVTDSENNTHYYIYHKDDPNDSDLDKLGEVTGVITLTIDGTDGKGTTIGTEGDASGEKGNVFGGGNMSKSLNNASVTLKGKTTVLGNVFGGGNKAAVEGSATVNIE